MRFLLLVCCCLTTAEALASPQNFLAPFSAYQAPIYLHDVLVVDLDADGLDDVVVLSDFGVLTWWKGDGSGALAVADTAGVPTVPFHVLAANLNGDALPDLVLAGSTLFVLLGTGGGGLSAPDSIGTAGAAWTGHIVGDASADVVGIGAYGIQVHEGNGSGGFAAPLTIPLASEPYQVVAADWNADDTVDLAVWRYDDILGNGYGVLLGTGGGSFASEVFYPSERSGDLIAVDANQDTRLDLVIGAAYLPGDGSGAFGPEVSLHVNDLAPVAALDLDGDGDLDLAGLGLDVVQFPGSSITVLRGNGDGTMSQQSVGACGIGGLAVSSGNLDGDQLPDIVVGNYNFGQVQIFLGSVLLAGRVTEFPAGPEPKSLAVGDLTGDMVPDVVVASSQASTIRILPGLGGGSLGAGTDLAGPVGVSTVALLDVDGNGILDIACASGQNPTVSIFRGTGGGTFAPRADYVAAGPTVSLDTGDLDGNGQDDVVAYSSGTVSVFLAGPAGVLGPRADRAGGGLGIAIARINGDAFPDVALPGPAGTISWFPGSATGALGVRVDVNVGGLDWETFAVGDADGDGDSDVVRARIGSFAISVNDGLGGFVSLPTGLLRRASRLALDDLDDDGVPDLAAVSYLNQSATVLYGTGGGAMRFDRGYGTGFWPEDLGLADMDGDGHPDLVVANGLGNSVSVLLNTMGGTVSVMPVPDRLITGLAVHRVAPLPARSQIDVEFSVPRRGPVEMELLDVTGRSIHRSQIAELARGRHTRTQVRPPRLEPGVYWLVLRQGPDRAAARVVFLD